MIPIGMPQVGQDIPCGKILEWLKKENDPVEKGEILLTVESEKASFEVESDASGILLKILHREGDEVEILKPIGYIGEQGEIYEEEQEVRPEEAAPLESPRPTQEQRSPAPVGHAGKVAASPLVKRLAREHDIDLSTIAGTGPGGRIIKRDILGAIDAGGAGPAIEGPVRATPSASLIGEVREDDTVVPFSKMRRRIAERLTLSKQTIPHFYLSVDVDATDLLAWRKSINEGRTSHVTVTDIVVKAVASALAEFARMNAHIDAERMVLKKDVNVGIAVSVEDGLLVPVICNADRKSLSDISDLSKKNAEAARRGSVNPNDVGTFTVSTLGMCSIKQYLPIINPPECAILGVGSIEDRVASLTSGITTRSIMSLVLACDHRGVDGTYASEFLNRIKSCLENIRETEWDL